jgi:hypothetical protein
MTHNEWNHLIHAVKALSPEQMRQLRDEIDHELSAAAAALPPAPTEESAAPARKRIWEVAEEIRRGGPAEEWAKLPVDGAEQHDHYIYATPKRAPAR